MTGLVTSVKRWRRAPKAGVRLLGVLRQREARRMLREIITLGRQLPQRLQAPLPDALAALTPPVEASALSYQRIRYLVDVLSALGVGRPLGLCLRRSLLRYYFLRQAGLPLVIHFGARRLGSDIGGHAWLTLHGEPYYEAPHHVQPHTVMWSYPVADKELFS